jgi:ribosomal protein S8
MFYNIINIVKLHLLLKNKIIKVKLHKKDFMILKIFLKLNIVKYIKKYKNNTYLIYINTETQYTDILNLHKPSKPITINLKNLKKINKKKNNLLYLSTTLGLINSFEAENNKIGGFILMNVWL